MTEENLVEKVCSEYDKVIVIINANNAMELGWVDEYEQIRAVIDRYFYLPVSDSALEKGLLYPEHSFYQNGEFWFEAADGESYNRFAVADRLTLLSDETYEISFTVYEVDLMEYFDQGVSSDYYHLTSQEAAGAGFTRIASGTALALPHSYRDRATYQLLEYHTW